MTDSNINIQMNYWSAEITNLDVVSSLFDYIQVRFNLMNSHFAAI